MDEEEVGVSESARASRIQLAASRETTGPRRYMFSVSNPWNSLWDGSHSVLIVGRHPPSIAEYERNQMFGVAGGDMAGLI